MGVPKKGRRPAGAWFLATAWSIRDVVKAVWRERLGGMLPMVAVLLVFAVLLAFLAAISPIAPFVYPLF